MNICFYTSEQPSAGNLLNMGHLISTRPEHNYSFLNVRARPAAPRGIAHSARRFYSRLRANDGRFDFEDDCALLAGRLRQNCTPFAKHSFRNGYADAVNDDKSVSFLEAVKPDVIVQAGAGILQKRTYSMAAKGAINLHHGICPEVRGIESTFWCLFFGMTDKIGVTCHFIDDTLDTGAVIAQNYPATTHTSFVDIQECNYLQGRDVLVRSIDVLDAGNYTLANMGNVASHYFGNVDPFLYYALKRKNFRPLMKASTRATKMKPKIIVTTAAEAASKNKPG